MYRNTSTTKLTTMQHTCLKVTHNAAGVVHSTQCLLLVYFQYPLGPMKTSQRLCAVEPHLYQAAGARAIWRNLLSTADMSQKYRR